MIRTMPRSPRNIDHHLATGRFASDTEILSASISKYVAVAVPAALASTHSMHPLLDQVTYDAMRLREPLAFASHDPLLEPVEGDSSSISRWFDRTHPLDEDLTGQFDFIGQHDALGMPTS